MLARLGWVDELMAFLNILIDLTLRPASKQMAQQALEMFFNALLD